MTQKDKKLDKKKLEYFKALLLKIREDILHDVSNLSKSPVDQGYEQREGAAGHAQHMADVATDSYEREFNLGLASHERTIVARIDAALKRIEDGTYGFCAGTGKPIAQARLKALPYAEYSKAYQEVLDEQKGPNS